MPAHLSAIETRCYARPTHRPPFVVVVLDKIAANLLLLLLHSELQPFLRQLMRDIMRSVVRHVESY